MLDAHKFANDYFTAAQELLYLEAVKNHIYEIVTNTKRQYQNGIQPFVIGHLITMDFTADDLITDIDYTINLKQGFEISSQNSEAALNGINDRNAELTICQGYETFMKLIKKTAINIYSQTPEILNLYNRDAEHKINKRNLIWFLGGTASAKTYLSFTLWAVPGLKKALNVNKKSEKYEKYLDVLSMVRNKFSHVDYFFSTDDEDILKLLLDDEKKSIATKYFGLVLNDREAQFQISYFHATFNLQILNSLIFQTYKQILLHFGIRTNWDNPFGLGLGTKIP